MIQRDPAELSRDVEREWRRLRLKEFLVNIVIPLIILATMYGLFLVANKYYPVVTTIVTAGITAVVIPLAMWWGRKP